MHTLKVAVLDPSTIPGGYSFGLVREVLSGRLHLLPPFTRRIVPVPLSLHHPIWIEDPAFDLDNHLFRVGVPTPGGPRELAAVISGVASHPLDRTRPLWELHIVEGLERGQVACIAKVHHALADGVSSAEMLMSVMGSDGRPATAPARRPDPVPSKRALLADAAVDLAGTARSLPGQLRRSVGAVRELRRRKVGTAISPPRVFSGPSTSFNRALTADRMFVFTSLPLEDAKAVKKQFGTTLNDVVMAVAAGALRTYLLGRGEAVDRPLVAGVPVSTRTEEQRGTYGNRVSNMFTTLPIHLADPRERLRTISEVNRAAKTQTEVMGTDSFEALTEYTPPPMIRAYARLTGRLWLSGHGRPPINLIVSNVPGPSTPLAIAGARLEAIYSVGPILEGIGLNITMWSYRDQMHFGLLSCRTLLPDLWDLADALGESLTELTKLTPA